VRRADLAMIQWILAHFERCSVAGEVVREAAKGGHLWVFQLLEADRSHGDIEWSAESLTDAAAAGHWELMKWLDTRVSTQETRSSSDALWGLAVTQNKLEMVKWAVTKGFSHEDVGFDDWREEQWTTRMEIVRYLLENEIGDPSYIVEAALKVAARIGDLETMQWLVARDDEFDDEDEVFDNILYRACEHGHLTMVQWLLEHIDYLDQADGPSDAMKAAATHGKLPIVHWLWNNCSRDPTVGLFKGDGNTAMDVAAAGGHLEVLKFLDQIDKVSGQRVGEGSAKRQCVSGRFPHCTVSAMDSAAANGRLDVVKWLHVNRSEGCTTAAMDNAAANGHLKVVKWLHWNRSEGATTAAMDKTAARRFHASSCTTLDSDDCCMGKPPSSFYKNQLATLRWLLSNRTEGRTTAAMDGAAAKGNFQVLQWLHDCAHASCSSKAMDAAAGIGRLDIIKWLHTKASISCTSAAMDDAAAGGYLNVVRWLHANRTEGCTAKAMNLAAANGHMGVVRWLLEHRAEANIVSAIEHAIVCKRFEMMWYLDAQRTDHSVTLRQMRDRLRNRSLRDLTHAIN